MGDLHAGAPMVDVDVLPQSRTRTSRRHYFLSALLRHAAHLHRHFPPLCYQLRERPRLPGKTSRSMMRRFAAVIGGRTATVESGRNGWRRTAFAWLKSSIENSP